MGLGCDSPLSFSPLIDYALDGSILSMPFAFEHANCLNFCLEKEKHHYEKWTKLVYYFLALHSHTDFSTIQNSRISDAPDDCNASGDGTRDATGNGTDDAVTNTPTSDATFDATGHTAGYVPW